MQRFCTQGSSSVAIAAGRLPYGPKLKEALMLKEPGEEVGRLSHWLLAATRQNSVKPLFHTIWY